VEEDEVKLEDIGFYTLSDTRAMRSKKGINLERCELILTDRCNFRCPYCRGLKQEYHGDMPLYRAAYIITRWRSEGLKNVRFSGGEPTLYKGLGDLVSLAAMSCEHVAISTNGAAHRNLYDNLLQRGVNDFSVSLDACCLETCDKMSGRKGMLDKILDNIRFLAQRTYVTVGVVLTPENAGEIEYTVTVAKDLGVADIRIIPAAQWKPDLGLKLEGDGKYPIYNYRINNLLSGRPVRGIGEKDAHRCLLTLDDMAVVGNHHYPCIIYLREQGAPIGEFTTIHEVRRARAEWAYNHDCYSDPICRNNCLDVCVDYNNKANEAIR
jgi:sulfatase maturation enzyme AslB (radical SAM superfamily)